MPQVPTHIADWMMDRAPDVEGVLARAFGGTGLLRGGASDYVLALVVALTVPLMRWIMDRRVYGVSTRHSQGSATARCLRRR